MTVQDATPKLVDQYCVHDNELSTWAAPEVFELGVEWGRIYELVRSGARFKMPINGKNHHRALSLAQKLGRDVEVRPLEQDWSLLELSVY